MAEKAARKKPVRKAPARKDYGSVTEWRRAQLEFAEAEERKAGQAKRDRLLKRIAVIDAQQIQLDGKRADLEKELIALDELVGATDVGPGTEATVSNA